MKYKMFIWIWLKLSEDVNPSEHPTIPPLVYQVTAESSDPGLLEIIKECRYYIVT